MPSQLALTFRTISATPSCASISKTTFPLLGSLGFIKVCEDPIARLSCFIAPATTLTLDIVYSIANM